MSKQDPEQERRGLGDVYAAMADAELQLAARDAASLTDEARQKLQEEFARRNLKPEADLQNPQPSFDVAEFDELVILQRFRDLPEAIVAKGLLDTAAIECFLVDEHLVRIDWFWSNLIGGVKLCVREADEEVALEALAQAFSPRWEAEGVGTFEQPSCPKCHSLDVNYEAVYKGIGLASAWVIGVPIPLRRHRWKCNACGHTWRAPQDADATTQDQTPTM
jgi:hypothetical protein